MMAREDIAEVFSRRITNGDMNKEQALKIIKQWFLDNPKDLYRLNIR